jgi:hypothetical protein
LCHNNRLWHASGKCKNFQCGFPAGLVSIRAT